MRIPKSIPFLVQNNTSYNNSTDIREILSNSPATISEEKPVNFDNMPLTSSDYTNVCFSAKSTSKAIKS
ncbi:unnamed protein product [Schistosoma mattheei]|uniref:Uncharacterized protein n=1 Tax=Schistosoma mattheei TaxID=31246 RepID=A0A183P5H4_9TREM|nr:unnamed protein product [Schistosoma mattheei]